ncbi:hypothetical protein [Micromonospora tulbaghiae]|uniref:Uncharacterized protein n=2 Tax=Micromonospora TaxID=1873 RepID=A0ABY0KII9_9ACTN|nr:hypothetical protein [Micromonospora tulbaghiae]MDX5461792.1 hypothetical protein [Micromonospora tulbaghiae]SCE76507.1 hypothetical protein GA0070562_2461 [Micromonospora tulbaghiae]
MTAVPEDPGPGDRRPATGAPVDGWRRRWSVRTRALGEAARVRTRRFWDGAQPTLRQLWWTEEPVTPVTTVDRRAPEPLAVPAQGQVYVFLVRATYTWSSETARPELFGWYVDYFQQQAAQRLHRLAVRCAVEVPPHRPRDLHAALTAALADDDPPPWTYARGEVTFACEPDVTVHLDERVRKLLQPYWEQRIALECERDLARRRAEYAEERDRRDRQETPSATRAGDVSEPATTAPSANRSEATGPARDAGGMPGEAGRARRGSRPDGPVESFTPLEPLLPPPAPRPAPGQRPRPGEPEPPRV